jgi:RNA polymerase sigma-70 factor (sigma-E family)
MIRRNRDEAEFREFVGRVSPTLLRTAYLLLRDRDAAEDAVQTALLRALRRWDRARENPAAYTHRVLVNVCRNHWRHQRRHPVAALTDEPEITASAGLLDSEGVDQRLVLADALAELPARQREVLVLRFFLDLSVPDTAQLLLIPEGTVKSVTSRGLDALRQLLSEEIMEVDDVPQ